MDDRERFLRCMRYEPVDRLPLHLVGAWPDTLERWYGEGLPRGVDVHEFLGVQSLRTVNVSPVTGPFPSFETCHLRDEGNSTLSIDHYGRTVRNFKDHTSMPEWIEFPVKTPEDLRHVLDEHYQVDDLDARFTPEWEATMRRAAEGDDLVVVDGGCYYWTLRSLAGVQTASYLFYDAPELVDELFSRYCTVVLEGIRRVSARLRIDVVGFGEDVAFKTGPLISPDMFRQYIIPRYRAAMDLAHEAGVEVTWHDSDGDVRALIPDQLKVGVNSTAPCEVAANMVPSELRRTFGRELRLIGGLDKREIAKGPTAIRAELQRYRAVIEEGGYLPGIDHSVSSDISFDNYRTFIDELVAISGG